MKGLFDLVLKAVMIDQRAASDLFCGEACSLRGGGERGQAWAARAGETAAAPPQPVRKLSKV